MALTDTTEYWWSVKEHYIHKGPTYYHHPTYKCKHFNIHTGNTLTTPYVEDITCTECKKYILENGTDGLKEGHGSPDLYMTKNAAKKYRRLLKEKEEFRNKYGMCSCGKDWVIRKNSLTGDKFLGCSDYPNCKLTKSLI